ncbi:serine hydrolase [Xanthovirga aplysinae]|uniref:serine hydrolase n=1 Tax=Xanthovirga aplysinae TaxID=2529853 RepID=UPI0012BC4A04|nr:serine hydrolase [Xanthovirga aplysinae]MTI31229.1 DUF4440 domain-containing protein [Xanthovirga aplysinae]
MYKLFTTNILLLGLFISPNQFLQAQIKLSESIFQEIMTADSLLFEEGFNNCNFDALQQLTDKNIEFYHDQSGTTFGQENFIETIKKNICSLDYRPKRKLLKESTEIYPLKNQGEIYGVVQNGVHEFYAVEGGKEPFLTSTAKFTHLWMKKENKWILQRVLSFDHKGAKEFKTKLEKGIFEDEAGIEDWLKENKVPALGIAVIKNGKLSKVNVYGHIFKNEPAPYNTIFNVASLTKPIVTMLTLKLVDNGDWSLDEPLYHYWVDPDVKNDLNSKKLTTRHILSHQTGFKNWRKGKLTFDFEPGTNFNYSGEGFEYLRNALEAKFKISLESLADSLIFKPLEMNESWFTWSNSVDEERFAKWHNSEGENEYSNFKRKNANAADDLLTTVEDYGKFAEFVLNGAGITDGLFNDMLSQQNGKEHNTKMGLGWEIVPNIKNNKYAILHTGGDDGVKTLVILFPESKEGMVVLTNGDNGNNLYGKLIEEVL